MNSKFVLFFLIVTVPIFPQNDLKVISSNRNSIVIEYTPSYSDTSVIEINNEKFIKIGFKDGFIPRPENWGMPSVPERDINVGVPAETGNTIQIISTEYKTLTGNISPKPKMIKDKLSNSFSYEIGKDYFTYKPGTDPVTFGIYGIMRTIPVQIIRIMPVEFNPSEGMIKLYTKIIFRINFSGSQTLAAKPAGRFISRAIINYDVARYWSRQIKTSTMRKTLTNSVLSAGKWVRFEAPAEGIYKITKSMLPSFGIDPATVDPRTIKIYNNGGKALPEDINAPRPQDLQENAILVVGQDDGKFDDGDYILFYGRGTNFWDYDTAGKTMKRFNDPYSSQNYYWITSGGSPGKRIQQEQTVNSQSPYIQTSTKAFAQLDEDKINIGQTGREYYGDGFNSNATSETYMTKLNGRIDSYPIQYNIRFINASSETVGLEVDEGSTQILNRALAGYGSYPWSNGNAYYYTTYYNGSLPDNRSVLKFTFTPTTASSQGYLDYFEILYLAQLQAVSDNLLFYSKDTTAVIQYNLSGFSSSNIKVFNVTDYSNVKLITNYNLLSGGECQFQENETTGQVSKYIAIGSDNYLTPVNPVEMSNSNLHGDLQGAQLLIITNKVFNDAAQRLQNYKETQAPEKYSTKVVDIDQIYNEFSCGMTDPTAMRDYIKYAFDNWQIKPEYVLFFGKGTYDAKNVEGYNQDFVPAYETQESLDEINSYTTDDYFVEVNGDDPLIDIAYGRIPVTNSTDANIAVDKIIQYQTDESKGLWRNLITLIADDEWTSQGNEGNIHTPASEYISNSIIPSSFDQYKIYLGTYPVVLTSDGRRMPQVNKDIISAINNGTLILNYIGHGNPELLAHEQVFVESTTIPQLHNQDYFFLVAATCDFGYWDRPNIQSSTEELVLQKDAGAVAAFTSARLVYSDNNHQLAYQLFTQLLQNPRDSLDMPITIGQAVFLTKQSFNDVNSQKYEIMGDPTISLDLPQYTAVIDSINGQNLSTPIQIKALSHVRISGEIKKPDNSLWSGFNGEGILTVYDSQRQLVVPALDNYVITLQGGVIFKGRVSIINGLFSGDFVVPKDISYENKNGKVLLYFYNSSTDGLGYTTNIVVGGTDTTDVNNKIGPDISIYFDDTTSTNAALVNPNSTLIVKLYDSNGLNTTGTGVGHKLEGILNGQANNPIDFTNYFTGDLNSGGTSGEINYKFTNLDPGNYSLKVSAWDVFNNYASKTVDFSVVPGNEFEIQNVYNYPDPFAYNTTFTFQQNLNTPINVKVKVYTVAGRLVREIKESGISDKFVKVNWDGRDQDGDLLANGTYLYKLIVSSADGQFTKSVLGKMAVIR